MTDRQKIEVHPRQTLPSGTPGLKHVRRRNANSVLILDDDDHFRGLIGGMLKMHGYEVKEARTAGEASQLIIGEEPGAAIVDYKLPGTDGLTWITQIREQGLDFPIIFVSGLWCDEPTFNWMRNVLRVSLIIQKPLVPELFMHTIEGVLPPRYQVRSIGMYAAPEPMRELDHADLLNNEAPEDILRRVVELLAEPDLDQSTVSELHALKEAAETQVLIAQVREIYAAELPALWQELVDVAARMREDADNLEHWADASIRAHKIKGSSGTCGLPEIAHIAEMVEDVLADSHPRTGNRATPAWTRLQQLLNDGTRISEELSQTYRQAADAAGGQASHLKLVGGTDVDISIEASLDAEIEAAAGAKTSEFSYGDPVGKLKVLCVDDDRLLTGFVETVLSKKGFVVQSLNLPIKILDLLDEFNPDIILLDAVMPGISGYEVCRMLKANEKWRDVPVIFMTANSCSRRGAAFRAGANDFLCKPLLTDELLARVQAQLSLSQHR